MRCSAWSSLAISVCSALVLAVPAAGHITVVPPFVSSAGTATLTLTAPNERDEPMTGLVVTVPDGFRISRAEQGEGWVSGHGSTTALHPLSCPSRS